MSSSEARRGRWPRPLAAAALLALAACASAPIRQYDLVDQPISCDEANRLAYRTVEAMGYAVGGFEPAAPGRTGRISASRDGVLVEQIDTKRGFHHAFINVQTMGAAQEEVEAQVRSGTAPASQQRRDLRVVIRPLRGQGSKLDFPFDLSAAGILPVRVEITNLTPRTYRIDADAVRLQRHDRTRVESLTIAAVADKVAAARIDGAPLTTLNPAAIGDALTAQQFSPGALAPNAQRQGFLYFPLAEYTSARAVLTDTENDEEEGVRVEF